MWILQRLLNVDTAISNLQRCANVASTALESKMTIYHRCCNDNVGTTLNSQRQIHKVLMTSIIWLHQLKEVTYTCNLRNSLICGPYKIKAIRYGTETIIYLAPKIWSIAPDETKESASLETFPQKINKNIRYSTETIIYIGPKILSIAPDETRESALLETFPQKIKFWKPHSCPCRICKKYMVSIRFVNLLLVQVGLY